jgi:uncharacterized protein (DUF4415 family)
MVKKSSASYRPEGRRKKSAVNIMRRDALDTVIRQQLLPPAKVPPEFAAQMKTLAEMPDEDIDFSDIPEITDFSGWYSPWHYRPIKKQISIRIDSDVLEWFRSQGESYQSRINDALRACMLAGLKIAGEKHVSESIATAYKAVAKKRRTKKST